MTGYGSSRGAAGEAVYSVEVKSVNHRFCEVSIRLPGKIALLEQDIIERVKRRFQRGKIDLYIKEEIVSRERSAFEALKRSYRLLKRFQKELHLNGPIQVADLVAFYGQTSSFSSGGGEETARLRVPLGRVVDEALGRLRKMRKREGEHLRKWFSAKLLVLRRSLSAIEKEAGFNQHRHRMKVAQRLKDITTLPDEKIAEGAAIAANRADVTEEIVRLESHLAQFQSALRSSGVKGRRLDFLMQEMGREINTLGSKVVGPKLIHRVIDFKTELERIKEQVQNVE
ncbi:MAG: YicC family protein [Deltaproteobacteria bacterium]|nr:YicC family protein [Deltaproteobacteria bacterium]